MMNFVIFIFNLQRMLRIISKHQILTHNNFLKLPTKIRIWGKFLALIFYPICLFKKPAKNFGVRLSACFEELGPVYIKFGQTLSTRPDLIGVEVAESLKYLQDKLPPFSSLIAKQIIQDRFEKTMDELFESFDDNPVAAASISQVHKAQLKTGEAVAVKILRPAIHKTYSNDIKFLYFLAKLISKNRKRFKRLKPVAVIDVFKETMRSELDLRLEAAAASEMLDNFKNDKDICIPKIYWSLTEEHIMTTEWIDGVSIYDKSKLLELDLDPRKISAKIAIMFFNQAYRDGFFHADLHPGNILVRSDGKIVLLDFGIVGRLQERDRLAIAEILFGFLNRNYKLVAEIHLKVGYIPEHTNLDLFAQACRTIAEPIFGLPIKEISIGKLLSQLFKVTEYFGMETQAQLLLLQKTMVVVEGIGHQLDAEINMWQLAEPWIKKWAVKNLTPEAKFLRLIKKIVSNLL